MQNLKTELLIKEISFWFSQMDTMKVLSQCLRD